MNFTQRAHPYARDQIKKQNALPSLSSGSLPFCPFSSVLVYPPSLPCHYLPARMTTTLTLMLQVTFTCFQLLHECDHTVPSWLFLFPFTHHCTCMIDPCCRGDSSCFHFYMVSPSAHILNLSTQCVLCPVFSCC